MEYYGKKNVLTNTGLNSHRDEGQMLIKSNVVFNNSQKNLIKSLGVRTKQHTNEVNTATSAITQSGINTSAGFGHKMP